MIYWITQTQYNYDKERWSTQLLYSFDGVNYSHCVLRLHDDRQVPDDILEYFEKKKVEFQNQLDQLNGAAK